MSRKQDRADCQNAVTEEEAVELLVGRSCEPHVALESIASWSFIKLTAAEMTICGASSWLS